MLMIIANPVLLKRPIGASRPSIVMPPMGLLLTALSCPMPILPATKILNDPLFCQDEVHGLVPWLSRQLIHNLSLESQADS